AVRANGRRCGRNARPGGEGQSAAGRGAHAHPLDHRAQAHRARPAVLGVSQRLRAEPDRRPGGAALRLGARHAGAAPGAAALLRKRRRSYDRRGCALHRVPPRLSGLDAAGATADWPPAAIDEALQAAAGWHAAFWGIDSARIAWAGPRLGTPDMVA